MKKYLLRIALMLILIASILYLIPSFQKEYKGQVYVFNNLPNAVGTKKPDLAVRIAKFNPSYRYIIESATSVKDKDWEYVATKDQKTLERRIESFVSDTYEVRLDNVGGKAIFSVFTEQALGGSSVVLTTNNSDFTISVDNSATSATSAATPTAPKNLEKIDLKRSDFGSAVINAVQDSEKKVTYQIKLPLGIVNPDKINLIKSKSVNSINVFVGGKDYAASFLPNSTGIITDLVITSSASVEEAAGVRTYLNTDSYYLGYKLASTELYTPKNQGLKLLGLIALFLAGAVLINKRTINTITLRKLLMIASYTIVGLAAIKLLGGVVTSGVVLILMFVALLSIFNSKTIYYVGFAVAIIATELFGYLYYINLNWTLTFILLITSLLIWSINYVKKSEIKIA